MGKFKEFWNNNGGSIIGSALKLGGGIFGGIHASNEMRAVRRNLNAQLKDNEDWFNRRYYEDATQRADAQRLLQMTEDRIRQRNKAAQGMAAVGGASTEAAAAQAEANSQEMANATAEINAAAAGRKDVVEGQYRANKAALNDQLNQSRANKANAITRAVGGVADAGSNIASLI